MIKPINLASEYKEKGGLQHHQTLTDSSREKKKTDNKMKRLKLKRSKTEGGMT